MKSKSSNAVDIALGSSKRFRKNLIPNNLAQAMESNLLANSKQYRMPWRMKKLTNATASVVANTLCYHMGSGSICVLYLHGGAYVRPPTTFHWRMIHHIVQGAGAVATVPIYQRAPIGTANTVIDDMCGIYTSLTKQYGHDNIVVMGDSAGGGMAMALCEMLLIHGIPQPKRMILLSPWLDITMTNEDMILYQQYDDMLMPEELVLHGQCYDRDSKYHWLANPIRNITKGLAPIDIFVGSHEMLLPDCLLAKEIAIKVGADMRVFEFSNMQHVWVAYPIIEAVEARNMIIDILQGR